MMSVLYVLSPGSYLRKIGERLLLGTADGQHKSLPVQQVEQVVCSYHSKVSTPAIYALLAHQIPVVYVDKFGRIKGVLGFLPPTLENIQCQLRYFSPGPEQIQLIRSILTVKLENQQLLLKSYAKSKHHDELLQISRKIGNYLKKITMNTDVDELRGLEGMAARAYFQAVPFFVDAELWPWQGRNRRPPKDPLNAMLSYGYTFLEREVRIATAGSGMDCRFGFFHSNNGRKDSLIFDLMELFRTRIIDRFVFRSVNLKIFSPEQFFTTADGCLFAAEGRRVWIYQYEKYMQSPARDLDGRTPRDWVRESVETFAK